MKKKGGWATAATLEKKAKFPVRATGFGREDAPGMGRKKPKADADKIAEQEEQEEKNRTRRTKFYRDETNQKTRRRHHIFIFGDEDLDNENIIAMVDTTPTYKRSKELLDRIKNKASEEEDTIGSSEEPTTPIPETNTIVF